MIRYADETFGLPAESATEVGRLWEQIEELVSTVTTAAPWASPDAEDLDRQTLDQWLIAHTQDPVALRMFRMLVPAIFSAEAPELSLLHFLFYVRSGTSLQTLVATTGGAQERRVVGGLTRSPSGSPTTWAIGCGWALWSTRSARTTTGSASTPTARR